MVSCKNSCSFVWSASHARIFLRSAVEDSPSPEADTWLLRTQSQAQKHEGRSSRHSWYSPRASRSKPYLWAEIGEEGKGDSRPWLLQGGCSGILFGNEDLSMMVTQVVGPLICPVAQP